MRNKTSKVALIIIATVLIIFTIINLVIFTKLGSVPDVLITAVFGACLGELGFMSLIRTTKQKYPDPNTGFDEEDDE